jgi:hypothetical protein
MFKRINPDYGDPRDEPVDWLDESVARSLSSRGDVLAFLQIANAGLTADGYAAFVRRGRDTVQVGNAFAIGLVPDGSAAVLLCGAGAPLRVVPTAMGAPHPLQTGPIKKVDLDDWVAVQGDGSHAVVRAAADDGEMRLWLVDLADRSPPAPIGPPSVRHGHHPISRDGEWLALSATDGITLVSTSGKPERTLRPTPTQGGLPLPNGPFEPLVFTENGRSLIVMNQHSYPRVLLQVALDTGEAHELWRFDPADRPRLFEAAVAGDASTMVYSVSSETSDLYVVEPPR